MKTIELNEEQYDIMVDMFSMILNGYIVRNDLKDPKDLVEIEMKNVPFDFSIFENPQYILLSLLTKKQKIRTSYNGYYFITAFELNNDGTINLFFTNPDKFKEIEE